MEGLARDWVLDDVLEFRVGGQLLASPSTPAVRSL